MKNGFTVIELVMVIAIFAIVTSIALPEYTRSLANTRVKATAESILAGLRDARSNAIQRNAPVRFQLMSSLDSSCTFSTTSPQWVTSETNQVSTGNPESMCEYEPWTPPDPCVDQGVHSCANDPQIITKSNPTSDQTVTVTADQPVVVFSPLGRITNDPLTGYASPISLIQIRSTVSGTKQIDIRITSPNGAVKICIPSATAGSPNGC